MLLRGIGDLGVSVGGVVARLSRLVTSNPGDVWESTDLGTTWRKVGSLEEAGLARIHRGFKSTAPVHGAKFDFRAFPLGWNPRNKARIVLIRTDPGLRLKIVAHDARIFSERGVRLYLVATGGKRSPGGHTAWIRFTIPEGFGGGGLIDVVDHRGVSVNLLAPVCPQGRREPYSRFSFHKVYVDRVTGDKVRLSVDLSDFTKSGSEANRGIAVRRSGDLLYFDLMPLGAPSRDFMATVVATGVTNDRGRLKFELPRNAVYKFVDHCGNIKTTIDERKSAEQRAESACPGGRRRPFSTAMIGPAEVSRNPDGSVHFAVALDPEERKRRKDSYGIITEARPGNEVWVRVSRYKVGSLQAPVGPVYEGLGVEFDLPGGVIYKLRDHCGQVIAQIDATKPLDTGPSDTMDVGVPWGTIATMGILALGAAGGALVLLKKRRGS
jgi:hypothetical protein